MKEKRKITPTIPNRTYEVINAEFVVVDSKTVKLPANPIWLFILSKVIL